MTSLGSGSSALAAAGAEAVGAAVAAVAAWPGVTLMTGVAPGVGDVTGPGAAGVILTTDLGGAVPPPMVNCATALNVNMDVKNKKTTCRKLFMKGLHPEFWGSFWHTVIYLIESLDAAIGLLTLFLHHQVCSVE